MHLESYVQPDYGNTSITVLAGQVIVELTDPKENVTLGPSQSVQVSCKVSFLYELFPS